MSEREQSFAYNCIYYLIDSLGSLSLFNHLKKYINASKTLRQKKIF